MKRIFGLIALLLASYSFTFAQQQTDKAVTTETIIVKGNCGECKERIEEAAYLKGVKRAEWNKETKELTVSFRPAKVSLNQIEKSIATAGHDAGEVKASDSAYNTLPPCCAYRHEHAQTH